MSVEASVVAVDNGESRNPAREPLVAPAVVAARLGVSRDFVYRHADELGAIRLGSGPKAHLRFDLADAERRLASCTAGRESAAGDPAVHAPSRPRRRRASGTRVELLPIRGATSTRPENSNDA